MKLDRRAAFAIITMAAIGFALRAWVGVALPNMIWPDEVFQTLEQGHRLAFGNGIIPWEFREGTRSWLVPGLLAGVMRGTSWLSASSAGYLLGCAIALSLLSVTAVWAAARAAYERFGARGALIATFMTAAWFELVYFAPKALGEVIAGNLLALGIVVTVCAETPTRRALIGGGSLLALATMLRVQLAPTAAVALAFVLARIERRERVLICGVVGVVIAGVGLLDALTWDYPFQSVIENVRINVLQGKSAMFGTAPWYAYFEVYARLWGVIGLLVVALAILGARRAPGVAACAAVSLASHILIAHKEYRFAYPTLVLAIVLAGIGAASCITWIEQRRNKRAAELATACLVMAWLVASLVGATRFHQARTNLAVRLAPAQSHWAAGRGRLLALQQLSDDPGVCGVGLVGIPWFLSGGYTYLHRDVPIKEVDAPAALGANAGYLDALVTPPGLPDSLGPFSRRACWDDACLYRRTGTCDPMDAHDINRVLRERGQ